MNATLSGTTKNFDSMAYNGMPYPCLVNGAVRLPHRKCEPKKPACADAVFALLRAHPEGVRGIDLRNAMGITKSSTRFELRLEALTPWGLIYEEGHGTTTRFFLDEKGKR